MAGRLAAVVLLACVAYPAGATIVDPIGVAAALQSAVPAGSDLDGFYRARGHQPLWIDGAALRPEAAAFLARLERAGDDGLSPERYEIPGLSNAVAAARSGDAASLAQAEALLSRVYSAYLTDLHRPHPAAGMTYVHDGLAPRQRSARDWLEEAARAPSLADHIAAATRMNPVYEELRAGLAAYRARWSTLPRIELPAGPPLAIGAQGPRVEALRRRLGLAAEPARFDAELADALRQFQAAHGLPALGSAGPQTIAALNAGPDRYERLIRANLERARSIPADAGKRFILVDVAGATLRAYEDGVVRDTMRVIVGKRNQATPIMAGRISHAVANPYWNLPPDLAQERARRVLRQGHGVLARERLEALSGWKEDARRLSPDEIDWKAVAEGRQELRMRQLPGAGNMMGKLKFMLPNRLGIYLHDTPNKASFKQANRRLSSGCVRVEDAPRLARWLFDGRTIDTAAAPQEHRIDLPTPVPVYITYLTVEPRGGSPAFRPDPEDRDPALLAALDRPAVSATASSRFGTTAAP